MLIIIITMKLLLLISILTYVYSKANIDEQLENAYGRPESFLDYLKIREQCTFRKKRYTLTSHEKDCVPENVILCEVNATLSEGSGFYRITRVGPFTTTGGGQDFRCDISSVSTFRDIDGAYITRYMVAPFDIHTGILASYPPIHFHHGSIVTSDTDFRSHRHPMPKDFLDTVPWLHGLHLGASSSVECLLDNGATACLSRRWPKGVATKVFQKPAYDELRWKIEDERRLNSPPMSTYLEFAIFYVTEPSEELKNVKIAADAQFTVGDVPDPHTYDLPVGKEVLNVGTFYIAINFELTATNLHTHAADGDEVWAVRGTQDDLGVPIYARSEVVYSGHTQTRFANSPGHVVKDGQTLESLKAIFEYNIHQKAEAWEKLEGRHPYNKLRDRIQNKMTGKANSWQSFVKLYNPANPEPMDKKPEILCKWYGQVQHVSDDDVATMKANYDDIKSKPYNRDRLYNFVLDPALTKTPSRRVHNVTTIMRPNNDVIGEDGYVVIPINTVQYNKTLVPKEKQNIMDGILPGKYYRHPETSLQRKDPRYTTCNLIKFDAGDYFTIIDFSVARQNPLYDDNDFFDRPVKSQHTRLYGSVLMPDVPYFD